MIRRAHISFSVARRVRLPALAALLVLTAAMSPPARAQTLSSVPAAFAELGRHARPAGMGGAFVSIASGVESASFNPAGAAFNDRVEAGFLYSDIMGLVGEGEAMLSVPLSRGRLGMVLAARSAGDEVLREMTGLLTVGLRVGRLGVGTTFKIRRATFGRNIIDAGGLVVFEPDEIVTGLGRQVQGDANGLGFDAGLMLDLGRGVRLGAIARDLYSPVAWSSGTAAGGPGRSYVEGVPPELVVGVSAPAFRHGLLGIDVRPALDRDMVTLLRVGTEWRLIDVFSLRGGTERFLDDRRTSTWSVGFGIDAPYVLGIQLAVDYAYVTGWLGATQSLALFVRFE